MICRSLQETLRGSFLNQNFTTDRDEVPLGMTLSDVWDDTPPQVEAQGLKLNLGTDLPRMEVFLAIDTDGNGMLSRPPGGDQHA